MRYLHKPTVEVWGGMECTINRVGNEYFDQLKYSGHRNRMGDIELFASLGLKKFRYPILWEHHQPQKNIAITWDATDKKLTELRNNRIDVIAGLVHHGSGPAFVNMLEDSFVTGLAEYARQVAERFPWIAYYTPVNEPLTTARFCGLYGIWYPHENNDISFCRILVNECMATALAMAEIRKINPLAKLVQTDDLAKIHSTPHLQYQADFENERRWLSYDLLCGKVNQGHMLWAYLIEHDIGIGELEYFVSNPCPPDILGVNYYLTSERYLDENIRDYPVHTHGGNGCDVYADVEAVRVGKICQDGIENLLRTAWNRYQNPIAITEVHLHCTREEQMRWLNEAWHAANVLNGEGVSVIAITPWALLGAHGWDQLLTCEGGNYETGVFDISSGVPRPTALAKMIRAMSVSRAFRHPVLETPGWWKRSCRAAYGEDELCLPIMDSGKYITISGHFSEALIQVCLHRGLSANEGRPDDNTWAVIEINEYLEIYCESRGELVVALTGDDLFGNINKALDLLLDQECGYWELNQKAIIECELTN